MTKAKRKIADKNKYTRLIDQYVKTAGEKRLSDLDILDQIPDNEIVDEPVPFPYGGDSGVNKWI